MQEIPNMKKVSKTVWYTDSAIRLNYRVMSETAERAGIPMPAFKEYERQVKAGERILGISVGRGY